MPNLELFSNAGFPFTRMADLSETVVVMPLSPSPKEIELLLCLMSHFGEQTGYPSLRVAVVGPNDITRPERDYLVLGNINDQPTFDRLHNALPASLDTDGVHIRSLHQHFDWMNWLWEDIKGKTRLYPLPTNDNGAPNLLIEGIEHPNFSGRSIVVITLQDDDAVDLFVDQFLERSQSGDISQTMSLLSHSAFLSYRLPTHPYHIGYISRYALMRIFVTQHPWLLLLAVSASCLLVAVWIRDYLVFVAANRLQAEKQPL